MKATLSVFAICILVIVITFITGKRSSIITAPDHYKEKVALYKTDQQSYCTSDFLEFKKLNFNSEDHFAEQLSEKVMFKRFVKAKKANKATYRFKVKLSY